MISLNKKARKLILIAIPLIALIILATMLIGKHNNNAQVVGSNDDMIPKQQVNVYLSSQDNTLVPLTVKYNSKETVGENMLTVLNLIKQNSPICNQTFFGLIPENTNINKLTLNDDKLLTIDFDETFLEYDEKHEVALLQSITWTMTEFEEVVAVSLTLNDEPLLKMPKKLTPVATKLTRDMGINNSLLTSTIDYLDSTRILSYYNKSIDGVNYVIPVSQYVKNEDNLSVYDLTITKLFERPNITSRLTVIESLKDLKLESSSSLDDNILTVSLNEKALFDEQSVQLDVYKMIRASLDSYQEVKDVSFVVNDETLPVNGIQEDQTFLVSSIVYNQYYI